MTHLASLTLVGVAAAYLWGVERVWRDAGRGRLITSRHITCAVLGLMVAGAAVAAPIDDAAHARLSMHMVQHLLLLLPAAVLLAGGRMATAMLWLLPSPARRRVTRATPAARRWVRGAGWLTLVWTVHLGIVLLWHVPAAYEAALRQPLLHVGEHVTMAGTSLALWWTVWHTKAFGSGSAYAAATAAAGSALGVLMVFAPAAWYPTYAAAAPSSGAALADQQLAGALMWVVGGAGYLGIGVVLFVAWLRRAERRPDDRWRRQAGSLSTWLLLFVLLGVAAACRPGGTPVNPTEAAAIERGRDAVVAYGCVACHQVPHVAAPQGDVGPTLQGFGSRSVIAGQLPNTPENIVRWVQDPQAIDPGNVMPTLDVSDADAAAIAAFLGTLE